MTTEAHELPDFARKQIGRTFPTLYDTVEEGAVRKYLQAMGEAADPYADPRDPTRLRHAPALFLATLAKYPLGSQPPRETDGLGGIQETFDVDLPLERTIVGGQEWDFHRLPRIGERIAVQTRISDIKRTRGRLSNEMYVVTKEITYRDASGELIAVCWHQRVKR